MRLLKHLGLILAFLLSGLIWADDFDAEVEESMAESDAAASNLQAQREREELERREAETARAEGTKIKREADARKARAAKELAELERDIQAHKKDQAKYKAEKLQAEKSIAKTEAKLKASMDRLNKLREENQALRQIHTEQTAKINDLTLKQNEVQANIQKTITERDQARLEVKKSKSDLQAAEQRLKAKEIEYAKGKAANQVEIQKLKSQWKANKDKTSALEVKIKEKQAAQAKDEEQLKFAVRETKRSEAEKNNASRKLASMDAPKREIAKECKLFDRPDDKAKAIGKLRAGMKLPERRAKPGFHAVMLKSGKNGYFKSNCFKFAE